MSEDVVASVTPFACCLAGRFTESCLGRFRTFVFIVVLLVKITDLAFNILLMLETMNELEEIDRYMLADKTNYKTKTWSTNLGTTTAWNTNVTWNTTWDTNSTWNATWATSTTWRTTSETSTAWRTTLETSTAWDTTLDTNATWNATRGTNATGINTNSDTSTAWHPFWDPNWNRTYCNFVIDYDISETVGLLKTLLIAFQVYIGAAVFLLVFYIIAWSVVTCNSSGKSIKMTMFSAMGKFQVYLALAYDIPMNTMAIEMQWLHGGEFGIDCWMCSKDSNCSDVRPLSLVSPLKIFSDDQNERAAADLWLTLGLSSLSTFIDLISVANPYFVSVTLYYFLCCASGSNDAAGRYFLAAYYAFWGVLAGVHVQMTNLTLLDRHLLPQGDYPWEFKSTITILMVISFVASYMDCLLTFCGCCRWCSGSEGALTRRIAYPLFIWNLVFFAMNIAKTALPISRPKESYITVVAIGGGFILFWMGLISILLIFLCCDMDDAIRSLGRLVQVDVSSNRVHP